MSMRLSYVEYGDGPALTILHGLFGSCRSRKPIAFISEPFQLRCQPLVMVMQTANLGKLQRRDSVVRLHRAPFRAVHCQRQVRAPAMVVVEVHAKDAPQVAFAQDNDEIQTIPAYAADQALNEWVLPGAARSAENLFDAHALYATLKALAVDRIAIPQQVPRSAIPRDRPRRSAEPSTAPSDSR